MNKEAKEIFTIKLADIALEVKAFFSHTKDYCQDYLVDEKYVESIVLNEEDFVEERKLSNEQQERENGVAKNHSDSYLETLVLCRKAMAALFEHNILLFHGAVMVVNDKAYLFTAKSGTGKTTHCKLWLKNIPNCHILNGDKPLLWFKNGQIYVCGSPWQGKEHYGTNEIKPLAAICFLNRDTYNHIEEVGLVDNIETLLNQAHIPSGNDNIYKTINLFKNFANIKLYKLYCNMEDEAAKVAYQAIVK